MRSLLFFLALLPLVASQFFLSPSYYDDPPAKTCVKNSGCSFKKLCVNGLCEFQGTIKCSKATAEADCGVKNQCIKGRCIRGGIPLPKNYYALLDGNTCVINKDCSEWDVCANGVCKKMGTKCSDAAECGTENLCVSNICTRPLPQRPKPSQANYFPEEISYNPFKLPAFATNCNDATECQPGCRCEGRRCDCNFPRPSYYTQEKLPNSFLSTLDECSKHSHCLPGCQCEGRRCRCDFPQLPYYNIFKPSLNVAPLQECGNSDHDSCKDINENCKCYVGKCLC